MYVRLSGRTIYLGKPDDPETHARYHRAVAEWLAAGRQLPADVETLTVKELIARFWVHAEDYYRHLTDGRSKELEQFKLALRPLNELYGETRAGEFGPRSLKAVRQKMIEQGWCRPYVNKQVNRVRHVFKWGVGDEIVPGAVLESLRAVPGLKRGRTDAPEPEKVTPVPMRLVEAVEPFVSRQVWAVIQLQLLTAARAGELLQMRPCEVDRSKDVWVYRPPDHKTAYRGHDRKIFIGPRAQEVLAPFLLRDAESFCFSPAEAERQRYARLAEASPNGGRRVGANRRRKPRKQPGDRYTTCSYRRAIQRGCDQAFPAPAPLAQLPDETPAQWKKRLTPDQAAELKEWQMAHRWHPHQLRHNAATEIRRDFGLEAARIILGHNSTAVTEIYAEKDEQQAIDAINLAG